MKFKKGDKAIMVNCYEAEFPQNKDVEHECICDSFKSRGGTEVVFLKGISGYFCTDYLESPAVKKSEA